MVRKPGISAKAVSKDDATRVSITGVYFGRQVSDAALANLRNTGREDLEMYEARLAWDCINERPQWYFARHNVPRSDAALHEYATDLWANALEVTHARKTGHHPKNHKACMYRNSPCKFLGICSGKDTADSDRLQKKAQVHVELPILEGDGRDVLTNSRFGEFMLCRRKHYFQYELGIERIDEEEREALYFGNCWHTAQEAYFNALKLKENRVSTQLATPRSTRSGLSVQTMKRPSISEITGKGSGLPNRYIVHAVEGFGKTSLGAQTPKPILSRPAGETGLETLEGSDAD